MDAGGQKTLDARELKAKSLRATTNSEDRYALEAKQTSD